MKEEIKAAAGGKRLLRIKGYRTSEGAVVDYDVVLRGPEFYKECVEASLNAFDEDIPAEVPEHMKGFVDQATWDTACKEQRESFRKSLAGEHKTYGPKLTDTPDGYAVSEGEKPEEAARIYLRNLGMVDRKYREEAVRTKNSQAKTKVKEWIRKRLPVDIYIPMLAIEAGKVESIRAQSFEEAI